jgi:phage-related protein (TIGR01555 family)
MLELLRGSSPETKGRQPGEYRWPELPEGVLPTNKAALALDNVLPGEVRRTDVAMDSAFAGIPNIFGFLGGNGYGAGLWFPGYPYLAELTQISEYRAPSETTSTEMTRKWFDLQSKEGGDKSKQISEIRAACDEFKVRDLFRRAAKLDGEFGRAQIYINIDDANEQVRQLPLEITPEGIAKGSLKSIQCIEPYWSTPYSWNAMYPERADFYKPTSWYIMGRKTHATRLLTFIGREVPDLLKPAYNFGGISLTQLMEPYVNAWLRTRKSVNDLISNFSIPVLYTDLAATLTEGGEPGSGLLARVQSFTVLRNNQSVAVVNQGTEEFKFAEATLASLDKLQAQSQEHMAAPAHVPLIKLFGVVPTGLNATGEGEIQVWYDWINASQVNLFEPNLYKLLKIIQLHLYGKIDDDLIINWISLDEPTPKELSDIRKSDADAGAVYIQNSVITNDEERKRLQSNPESGYTNLVGNAPLPEPDPEPTTDPDNDAQREHDADQADKNREHETGKAVLAAAAKPEPAVPIRAKTKG